MKIITHKLKLQNIKLTKQKNHFGQNSKTLVTKLKNSKCDKTQNATKLISLKLWEENTHKNANCDKKK